ncbi:MAG: D-alanyl-D-alanine carboxypeptidase [Rhodospirillales bacterium]|nr:D-alanyl-D-alanine carboxypeptidase [Rhodospirillales bacterium]
MGRTAGLILGILFWLAAGVSPSPAVDTAARHAIMIDHGTGTVLLDKDADTIMPPASMSKLMTIYLLFEQLADGGLSLEDTFMVSEKAWRMAGSKMFVLVNTRVKIEDLLRGIVVQSGNDACVVVAEGIGGSEEGFADIMNEKAAELGLTNSTFVNSTGWPHPDQRMTARDLATLASHIITDFPQYYGYFKETWFTYNKIKQSNRNPLLFKDIGADGLKTGHTEAAGFGLTSSAERDGRRLILVTAGLGSMKERASENARLINWGFRDFENYDLFKQGETVSEAQVWLGQEDTVPLIMPEDVRITLRRKARKNLEVKVVYTGPVPAPITEGQKIAEIHILAPETETRIIPLLAGKNLDRLGFFGRLSAGFKYLLWGTTGR